MTSQTAPVITPPIAPGQIAPFFVGITNRGKLYSFEGQAGRPAVLLLIGALNQAATPVILDAFAKADVFQNLDTDVVALTSDGPWVSLDYTMAHPTPITIACDARAFAEACGLSPPAVLAIDAGRVVVAALSLDDVDAAVAAAAAAVQGLAREAASEVGLQAPVLLLRNVISRDFCATLMDLYEKGGHFDSGFMSITPEGAPVLKIDHSFKRRSDHFIHPDHPMCGRLMEIVANRIAPEIKKAFHVDIAHCERFLIACYDDSGGYFRRHRDDSGAANAHRQFAITLNLNAEDYEGGHLAFPEYGPHRYRPGTGEAIIFSGSMLHEALPVTRGKRFALLGFLHSEEAEARRRVYLEGAAAKSA